jgi:aryl-alcohol dehydrogenase-like predicted oxidoreductase
LVLTKISRSSDKNIDKVKNIINRLGLKPDAILAHSADDYLISSYADELQKIKDKYQIKIGVSVYTSKQIERIITNQTPDIIQCPLNILDTRLYQCGILDKLKAKNIEIHVRSVFLQGMFYISDRMLENNFSDVMPAIKRLKKIAHCAGLTLPELSLMWVYSLMQVDKVIVGIDSLQQLKINLLTLMKKVDSDVYKEALSVQYKNDKILNPTSWKILK